MLGVINKHLKQSFSSDSDQVETFGNVLIRQTVFLSCVVVIALILKPDLFGLIPNSLDPMFYTGYAINLDDALAAAGNRHYFVTRWSSYMPQYVACQIFGAYWGRIALRLTMLAILSEVFWRIGKRFKFSAHARIIASLLVFMMPMFVRAFTTDYQEYSSTFYGILLVTIACTQSFTWKWGSVFGAIATLMVISNPNNIAIASLSAIVWFVSEYRSTNLLHAFGTILTTAISSTAVVLFGYILFEYHYHIGNVYKPTLDFMRSYVRPDVDLWTAPGTDWIYRFGWVYIPPVLVIVTQALIRKREDQNYQLLQRIKTLTFLVFLYHVVIQIRSGHALETSFYWALALPPVYLLFAVLSAWAIDSAKSQLAVFGTCVCFIVIVKKEIPQHLQTTPGVGVLFLLLGIIGLSVLAKRLNPNFLVAVLSIGLLWLQIGSPDYNTLTYGGDSNTPRYDLVYGSHSEVSNEILRETIWFTEQMDQLSDDWKSTFLSVGGWSAAIVGTYIPHPFSRWIVAPSISKPLTPQIQEELEFGRRKYLAIFGDPREVAELLPNIKLALPRSKALIDKEHDSSLRYRLVVLIGNSEEYAEATILPTQLERNIGLTSSDGSVLVPRNSPPGFATFGPYISLGSGHYVAELKYKTSDAGKIGRFDVFNDLRPSNFSTQIVSNGPGEHVAGVPFEVTDRDSTWQLRTEYLGKISFRISQIKLIRIRNQ